MPAQVRTLRRATVAVPQAEERTHLRVLPLSARHQEGHLVLPHQGSGGAGHREAGVRQAERHLQVAGGDQADCDAVRPGDDGHLEMMDGDFWAEASTAERYRLVELLVEGATLYTDHLTMEIKTEGVKSLMEEVENESNLNDN